MFLTEYHIKTFSVISLLMNMNYKITWDLVSWNFFITDLKEQRHQRDGDITDKDYKIYRNKSAAILTGLTVLMLCFPSNLTQRKSWALSVLHKSELCHVAGQFQRFPNIQNGLLQTSLMQSCFHSYVMVLHLLSITQICGVFHLKWQGLPFLLTSILIFLTSLCHFVLVFWVQICPVFYVTGLPISAIQSLSSTKISSTES